MTSKVHIPDFFLDKLKKSPLNRLVEQVLANYSDWILRNETIFFREYTDHGINHIESILETADLLLTIESRKKINDADTSLLIISTVLHDVALHIQEYQFLKLVSKNNNYIHNKDLDSAPWHSLWIKYTAEASRFNRDQLNQYFGVSDPIPIPSIESYEDWKPNQYLLIGEFLRRHHARLAHDFAIFGFPAIEDGIDKFIKIQDEEYDSFIDLAGLVARSHGVNLRSLFDYLKKRFSHLRIHEGAHTVFVMTLLRIADFLQLQKSRAPKGQMIVKNLRSPLSRREWNVHGAIQDIRYDSHNDPESVEVLINPKKVNIEIFLRLKDLLNSLQKELDHTWAVLGEIYGRFPEKVLGIIIRRVRSNIDDVENFGKLAGFVLKKATFTAADAELLKLFIKPLYGDKPEIAVRELIQNSVDAVRERLIFDSNNKKLINSPSIIVSIYKKEDGKWILKIQDYGIGMSLNTIMFYFLNAGASFRLSRVWKEKFLDSYGKAKVLRSGRFGVGALAAFMLSDDPTEVEMKVTTRHMSAPIDGAFEFKTRLSGKPIQISFTNKEEIGTTIEIITTTPPLFMSESENKNTLDSWDWYCLDFPIVERIGVNGKRVVQSVKLPADPGNSKHDYHWIKTPDYEYIGWTYSSNPNIVCNGIVVTKSKPYNFFVSEGEFVGKKVKVQMPNLSIFDKNGKLPITLDRLRIDYKNLQFLGELYEDIEKNIAAFLLVYAPVSNYLNSGASNSLKKKNHPALSGEIKNIPWLFTKEGVLIYCPELLHLLKSPHLFEVSSTSYCSYLIDYAIDENSEFSFTLNAISTWEFHKKRSDQVKYATRVKVQRSEIRNREFKNLIDLLDSPNRPSFETFNYPEEEDINIALKRKLGVNTTKLADAFYLVRTMADLVFERIEKNREPMHRFNDRIFYDLERAIDRNYVNIKDVKRLLFRIITSENREDFDVEAAIVSLLNKADSDDQYRQVRDLIDRLEHVTREIIDQNGNRDLREILHEKLSKLWDLDEFRSLHPTNIKYIIQELNRLESKPAKVSLERIGTSSSLLKWEEIIESQLKSGMSGFPITEFCLKENYKETDNNNLLSRIWLKYFGDNSIPYEEEERNILIGKLEEEFEGLDRHINHWRVEFNEEKN